MNAFDVMNLLYDNDIFDIGFKCGLTIGFIAFVIMAVTYFISAISDIIKCNKLKREIEQLKQNKEIEK